MKQLQGEGDPLPMIRTATIANLARKLPPPDMRLPPRSIQPDQYKIFKLEPAPQLAGNLLNPLRAPMPREDKLQQSLGTNRYQDIADLVKRVEMNRPSGLAAKSWLRVGDGISPRKMAEGLLGYIPKLEEWLKQYNDGELGVVLEELIEALRGLQERKSKRKRVHTRTI